MKFKFDPNKLKHALYLSLAVHLAGLIAILVSAGFDTKPKAITMPSAPPVQAVVIDQEKVAQAAEKIKKEREAKRQQELERQREIERKAAAAKRAAEAEQKRLANLEKQRKQRELEVKKAEEAAKQAKLKAKQEKEKAAKEAAERQRKEQERLKREKAAAEKRKKEEAERKRKAEEEAKRKAAAEKKAREEAARRAEMERQMQEAMAAEQAAIADARSRQVMSEVQRFQAMISATIQRNWNKDETMRGKSCRLNIRIAPDGFVTRVSVLSGDSHVCRSAEFAVNKAGRLPVSKEPDVYQKLKDINLTVRPEFD
ncbi:cell envelope integrity protein TolA [Paraferrimonas haliotis]|uniref:Cell division and transport-associated protein TolA n=1 Tax=Paraferrimonas haliotis TaxID=2013866 RepID=A0AA37WZ01_9GAMM|nr:cell envelope integrity protein TolA [Paraferrimonas haliotis]GLS84365.1 hypothetical protein GCM10007894_23420 [Paraferrimonas haliotis]